MNKSTAFFRLYFLVIVGLLFLSRSSTAQQPNEFYFRAGATYNNFSAGTNTDFSLGSNSNIEYQNFRNQYGLFMGFGFDVSLHNRFHIVTGFNFGNYKSRFDIGGGGGVMGGQGGPGYMWTYSGEGKLNYWALQVPITLRQYIGNNYFLGGGFVLTLIPINNSTLIYTESDYSGYPDSLIYKRNYSSTAELNSVTVGICLQAGRKFMLKNFDLSVQADLNATLITLLFTNDGYTPINSSFYSLVFDFYPHFKKE